MSKFHMNHSNNISSLSVQLYISKCIAETFCDGSEDKELLVNDIKIYFQSYIIGYARQIEIGFEELFQVYTTRN